MQKTRSFNGSSTWPISLNSNKNHKSSLALFNKSLEFLIFWFCNLYLVLCKDRVSLELTLQKFFGEGQQPECLQSLKLFLHVLFCCIVQL